MSGVRSPLLLCLAAAVLITLEPRLGAEDPPLELTTVRRLSRQGSFSADLGGKATLRVPEDYRLVTEDKLAEFAERMKITLGGDELGIIIPDDVSWYCILFAVPKSADPLAGTTDKANLDRTALMGWQEKYTADHTARKISGDRLFHLSWTHTPKFDADKKRLTMGVRVSSDPPGKPDQLHHRIFVYGTDAIIGLQTVTPIAEYTKPVAKAMKLADEVTFPAKPVEATEEAGSELFYYVKLGGGGLVGALVVLIFAKLLGGSRRSSAMPARRQGLPR